MEYNYLISQEDVIREPKIRVYTYESCSPREKRAEERERYPSMYKIFNNKPSFSDTGVRAGHMSQTTAVPNSVSQRPFSPQPHVGIQARETPKFEGEEGCIDAAAAGFIEWKKRTLQFC